MLQTFIDQNAELKEKYGNLLLDIDAVYKKMFDYAEADLWFSRLRRLSTSTRLMMSLVEHSNELSKPEDERKNIVKLFNSVKSSLKRVDKLSETRLLVKMFSDAKEFKNGSKIETIANIKNIEELVSKILSDDFLNEDNINELTKLTAEELKKSENEAVKFFFELKTQYDKMNEDLDRIDGALSTLMPKLTEVKKLWKKSSFVPDANSTLRLTYGYIKGYSPKDATWSKPFTTLDGVIDKSLWGNPEYKIPAKLKELYDKKDFGRFYDKDLGGVPVAMLYNMDTTGGNSGSPILNARGEIIGVNFDRAYEATINDYAWNESYSRSIGVDIRYCLWVTEKIGDAGHLLTEMGLN